jgi:ABC-2 type transport system permease protein
VDNPAESGRTVTELLKSSPGSWLSTDPDVMPRIDESGQSAFHPSGETKEHTLAVLLEGRFDSYFKGKPSPLVPDEESETAESGEPDTDIDAATLDPEDASADGNETTAEDQLGVMTSVIERSPESARLFVIGSNSIADDQVLRVLGSADGTVYSNSLQFMTNIVDWSVEDRSLLDIRSRGHFNRTLPPLEEGQEMIVEGLNYGLALLGVGLVYLWHRRRLWAEERRYAGWLKHGGAA